jgi:hypothetical protein
MSFTAEKRKKAAENKEKWEREKKERVESAEKKRMEDIKHFNKMSEQLSAKRRKNSIKQKELEKKKTLERKNTLAASLQEQAQLKADLERQERERRRQSVALNTQIHAKAREREEELLRKQKEEEHQLLEARRIDTLAIREKQLEEEESRRQSLAIRHEEFKKQKEAEERLKEAQRQEEKDLLATRRQMWEDRQSFSMEEKARHRASLAGRLEEWRETRKREQEAIAKEKKEAESDLSEKRQIWIDFNDIKKQCNERDRQSILWRLDKWRDERDLEAEERERQVEIANTERALMLQEMEDVMRFKEEQESLRRQSMAYRADAAARERDFNQGLEANKHAVMEMESMIHKAEQEDVIKYQTALEKARRESLSFRLQERVSGCCVTHLIYISPTIN